MTDIRKLALEAKAAARALSVASTSVKDAVLLEYAKSLRAHSKRIESANQKDMAAGEAKGLSAAMLDRLKLDSARIEKIAQGVEQIARLADPVGEMDGLKQLPNGLQVGRMKIPLGLIGLIYESRPNVTADAAALCVKSGNGALLRGGSEAFESNQVLAALFGEALEAQGLPKAGVSLLPTTDREAALSMLGLTGILDLVIPRGGEGLIQFVAENARVPVLQHYKGVCHVYVDVRADLEKAEQIVVNSKVQRPGVCNAAESLLVDRAIAKQFVPKICHRLRNENVELRGDSEVVALDPAVRAAEPADWDREYLDLVLSIRIVDGIEGALEHIAEHGSQHTESIVTEDYATARRFVREADASCVLVNAATRFNDGSELGLGAEMGISTTKLHAFGPMGLDELCARKWIGFGDGQIRN